MKWIILAPLLLWLVISAGLVIFTLLALWAVYALVFALVRYAMASRA